LPPKAKCSPDAALADSLRQVAANLEPAVITEVGDLFPRNARQ
jgi:hypothetical protein